MLRLNSLLQRTKLFTTLYLRPAFLQCSPPTLSRSLILSSELCASCASASGVVSSSVTALHSVFLIRCLSPTSLRGFSWSPTPLHSPAEPFQKERCSCSFLHVLRRQWSALKSVFLSRWPCFIAQDMCSTCLCRVHSKCPTIVSWIKKGKWTFAYLICNHLEPMSTQPDIFAMSLSLV